MKFFLRTSAIIRHNCSFFARYSHDKEYLPYIRDTYKYRYGYSARHHEKGLLPRLDRENEKKLKTIPCHDIKVPWNKNEATLGQNDYIDILGTGNLHPAQTLKHIPYWLRGWNGSELEMLQRKAHVFNYWSRTRPFKWHLLQKRIDFLYKFMNQRSKPPNIQNY